MASASQRCARQAWLRPPSPVPSGRWPRALWKDAIRDRVIISAPAKQFWEGTRAPPRTALHPSEKTRPAAARQARGPGAPPGLGCRHAAEAPTPPPSTSGRPLMAHDVCSLQWRGRTAAACSGLAGTVSVALALPLAAASRHHYFTTPRLPCCCVAAVWNLTLMAKIWGGLMEIERVFFWVFFASPIALAGVS